MALDRTAPAHDLPCGRHVEDVLDELDGGTLSGHTLTCAHCTTARHGIEALNQATRILLDDPAEPEPGLIDRIMNAVRVEIRHSESLTLPTGHGHADISVRAVASLLRFAADTVPGVRARHCHIEADPIEHRHIEADHSGPETGPPAVRIDMTLTVRYGIALEPLIEQVRGQLVAAMFGHIGLDARTINLEVVDLWDEEQR